MFYDEEWKDFLEKYDIQDLFMVYYTVYNGEVRVLRQDHNYFEIQPFIVHEEERYSMTPIMIMQKDMKNRSAYVYMFVVPFGSDDGGLMSFDKDAEEFRSFVRNLKPGDFKL